MGLNKLERNILAYRILTIGGMRMTTVDKVDKDHLTREVKDTDFSGETLEDKQVILAIEDGLEGVNYKGTHSVLVDTGQLVIVLTVEVTDEEGNTEQLGLEYLLTPREIYNPDDLYKINVIEEE